MRLLSADGVALVRGGRLLFEGLDLKLEAGEAVHVTGPNGSGKSSLLRLVAGLLKPNAGRIERSNAALVDDKLALDRELPLGNALGFWSAMAHPEQDFRGAVRDFGLEALLDVPVRLLSSGQQKRAALARVAASCAPLWLLDEPLNALDAEGTERLATIIQDHRRIGGAVLAASHVPLSGEWRLLELGQ